MNRFFAANAFSRLIIFLSIILFFPLAKVHCHKQMVIDIVDNFSDKNVNFWSNIPNEELSKLLVDQMTNEELFAQILMFGWAGDEPSELLLQWISMRSLGSVKVYGWGTDNTYQVAKSVDLVQRTAQKCRLQIPLYVATDQEGGMIRHIKGHTSDTPGNLAIGAGGFPIDAYYTGFYIAQELRALGINMNFAPTVDIYSNEDSTVIGPRSFSSNAEHVGILGNAFAQGTLKAGVIPTAKHFPGHGDTETDSHGALPKINIDEKTLHERELLPFKHLIENNILAIMSGHLAFPKIKTNGEPASLSKYFLQDILRKQLNYDGLIITDDMMMNGATIYAGSLSHAVRLAIEAGNDIIISSTTAKLYEALWTNNLSLMQSSKDFFETVKKAAQRVILSKLNYFKGNNYVPIFPDLKNLDKVLPNKEADIFFTAQAARSITFEKNKILPLTTDNEIFFASQYQSFILLGTKKFPNAQRFYFNYKMGSNEIQWVTEQIVKKINTNIPVAITIANNESAKIAEILLKKGYKIIAIAITSPSFITSNEYLYNNSSAVIFAYGTSKYSFNATIGAIAGDFFPEGKLPL
ncbi:MAG: glycoside hydrolase family 3 protein [Treponema sp.]|jgi:beta-N-acetylhexosaminidase|nr:glycoside hydrolase family 3 protein [Treponema sp.]